MVTVDFIVIHQLNNNYNVASEEDLIHVIGVQLSHGPVLKEGDVDSELEFNGRANDAVIATQPGNLQVKNVPINGTFVTLVQEWNTKLFLQRFNIVNYSVIDGELRFCGAFLD